MSKFYKTIKQSANKNSRFVSIVKSKEGVFYVGFNLTPENVNEGGEFGCRTYYTEEEALDEYRALSMPDTFEL